MNLYEWCGESTFEKSGFKDRTKEFENYSKPVFLSEYGCNLVTPRGFSEVAALYGPDMTGVWSGGVVYEWTQENNRYGLVQVKSGGEVELLDDYKNLKMQMSKVKPQGVKMDSYTNDKSVPNCPPITANWKASSSLPPTPSDGACECMIQNMECVASDKVTNVAGQSGNNTLGSQLDTMCGTVSCSEISGDAEKGEYGAFSFCTPRDKLSWLYNLKAKQLKTGNTCDYNGLGQEVKPRRADINLCAKIAPSMEGSDNGFGSPTSVSSASISKSSFNQNAFVVTFVCALAATLFM